MNLLRLYNGVSCRRVGRGLPAWVAALWLLCSCALMSQQEYTMWYFGDSLGLDFSSGVPVPLTNSGMHAYEGCAVMCDRQTGRVLFYTDGLTVWDSTHGVMQNGIIMRKKFGNNDFSEVDSAAAQSALIIPFPCDSQQYYVFTANDVRGLEFPLQDNEGLHCAVIDMRLNGGRGGVVRKNVVLLPRSTERLCGTMHANGRDYWVVTQELASYAFHAFPITCNGIGQPVISPAEDNVHNPLFKDRFHDNGMIKISPDGKRLAISGDDPLVSAFVDLYDFNPATGRIQNRVHIPHPTYGIGFSQSGKLLYTADFGTRQLYQYDLTLPTGAEIAASRLDLGRVGIGYPGTIQLGPDGKLYIISEGYVPLPDRDPNTFETIISVVEQPNERGAACNFRYRAFVFSPRAAGLGLPNNIDHYLFGAKRTCQPAAGLDVEETTICSGGEIRVIDQSADANGEIRWLFPGGTPSEWRGPDPPAVLYENPGRYMVMQIAVADICTGNLYDTTEAEVIVNPSPTVTAGPDVALCTEDSVVLAGSGTGDGLVWRWSPAEGLSCVDCPQPTARPDQTTNYVLSVTNSFGCTAIDTVTVWLGMQTVPLRVDLRSGEPGDTVRLPIVLDGTIEGESVEELSLRIRYDSSMFIPLNVDDDQDSSLTGTLLDGWNVTSTQVGRSEYVLTAKAFGAPIRLIRGATLLRLPGILYMGERETVRIELYAESPNLECSILKPDTAELPINICGLQWRLIEFGTAKYVAPRAVPNPARGHVRIEFSLGLDGPTLLEMFDLRGNRVGVLVNGRLEAGTYAVDWETGSLSTGVYWLRLRSGDWSAAERVLID